MFLQRTVCTLASLQCKFCKSVGHDEKDCRDYQLMREKMVDAYLMKIEEQMKIEQVAPQFQDAPQFPSAQQFQMAPQF